jgi:hypothetical protein
VEPLDGSILRQNRGRYGRLGAPALLDRETQESLLAAAGTDRQPVTAGQPPTALDGTQALIEHLGVYNARLAAK